MYKNIEQIKLSPYAKMFCIEMLVNPESARYNMIFMDELLGSLDIERLKIAIQSYIKDNLLMHCHIQNKEDDFYWVENATIVGLDYSDEKVGTDELLSYINQPFDLLNDQLCRFKLVRLSPEKYQFITVMHHLLTDALSVKEGVFNELSNYYNRKNHTPLYSIEQQKEKLVDLAEFYRQTLKTEKSKHQEFWQQKLANIEYLDLSFLNRENTLSDKIYLDKYSCSKQIQFSFDSAVVNQLNRLKRQHFITPYYFGLCVFAILLHRYTGQSNFVIPYPIAIKKGGLHIYGAQVNTTLMPYQFNNDSTFLEIYNKNREFLKSVKNDSLHYTDFPNVELFNESNKHLLNVIFNQANFRLQTYNFDGVEQKTMLGNFNMHLADMLLFEQEQIEQTLHYQVRFDITKMDEVLVQNFVDSFQRLFVALLNDLENNLIHKPLRTYSLLTPDMCQHALHNPNCTKKLLFDKKTIHGLFAEQVRKSPDNIAIIFEGVQLTYAELDQQADQLASYIHREYHPKNEDLIVLHLERSHHMIIAILAVLKTGCAYVPVSPDMPDIALLHVLTDTNAKLMLVNHAHDLKLAKFAGKYDFTSIKVPRLLVVDAQELPISLHRFTSRSIDNQENTNLAYVLYTSGSTGKPKGVMMEHLACVSKVVEMVHFSQITEHDIILFKTNYIFDVSFTDIFCGLLAGAKIVVTKESFNIGELSDQLENHAITVCHFTPSQFEIIKNIKGPQLFDALRVLHFSGEALAPQLLKAIDEKISCINYYGPTETGEVSAEIKRGVSGGCTTIGYPLTNVQFYILDNNLNPVPQGVVGELYIGGISLARGYLNQPALTQEKFIPNPFQSFDEKANHQNNRIYKTGDLVRQLLSGNVEYRGRNDSQIKIRGYRVELGEIENQLKSIPDVKHAFVLEKTRAQENKISSSEEKYLVAYYVSNSIFSTSTIRNYLLERLPEYMVPDAIHRISELPITANGKLDVKQLPLVELTEAQKPHSSPRNPIEEKICSNYAEILHLPKAEISIHDDFFRLGGNSMLAIRLLMKLQQNLDVKIADIFKLRTPKSIAENIPLVKDNIRNKIENIVQFYLKYNYGIREQLSEVSSYPCSKDASEFSAINNIDVHKKMESIKNVLLTGSTGHLGCNILGKLLKETSYKIYLPIRAESYKSALNRIQKKYSFYFSEDLNFYQDRLVILNADIQDPKFTLKDVQFNSLTDQIDSVIHCAALVKHYGEYEEFYRANVQTTENLLEFSRVMRGNSFNYISTVGVLINGHVPGEKYCRIDEDGCPENFKLGRNYYIQTKHKSELLASKYRDRGVNVSIYRVGNLVMHSKNYKVQENIDENLFFSHLKSMVLLKMIPEEISKMEISQVDCTADAIVKLFDKAYLNNQTHHIFNPKLCNLNELFERFPKLKIKKCSLVEFITILLDNIIDARKRDKFCLLTLYQLWHQECDENHSTKMRVAQEKTEKILGKLGFHWPTVTVEMLTNLVEYSTEIGTNTKENK